MKTKLIASALTAMSWAMPATADDACSALCDAAFYETATAADIQKVLDQGIDVNAQDKAGKTALHWAATAQPAVIAELLAAGATVNAKDQWDRTPLHFVGATGRIENVRLLLEAGADVNAETTNKWTPIHGACKFGAPENVQVLLDAGANPKARTEMGETAYDFAAGNAKLNGTEVLKQLQDTR